MSLERMLSPQPQIEERSYYEGSVHRWVLANGVLQDSVPLSPSHWPAVEKNICYFSPYDSFANCQRVIFGAHVNRVKEPRWVLERRLVFMSAFSYVEGFMLDTDPGAHNLGIPVYTAWLLFEGRVIDPTWRLRKPYRRKNLTHYVAGSIPDTRQYYGAVIPNTKLSECFLDARMPHPVLLNLRHGVSTMW